MALGRGSAMAVLVVFVLVVLSSEWADAATYTVGDKRGWTFNVAGWPKGKTFRAGDTLVFNYGSAAHNVVAVNKVGYQKCSTTPGNARVYQTGNDKIRLAKGQNFFICNFPGHCQSGMQVAITAV
ncbi:PREDICTED: basic blue protein-like [Fragaria vesca subsp. vesca]|uniref:basic blue protein-like n=1 Tax=Fragaria vesca subsp. vesca TaxID=101020 RepID=UPI0002C31845|nr:PREDICTED: basic blue protein-like [Fragaria vesca subsp. vesca]